MGLLFGRRAIVTMGDVEIDGLRVAFKIEKNAVPEPNTAEISVWNLSRDTRSRILQTTQTSYVGSSLESKQVAGAKSVLVVLQVGYGKEIEQIFSGDIVRDGIGTVRDGGDWVMTFKAADGAEAFRTARIQETFAKHAKLAQVFKKVAENLGIGMGNALEKIKKGDTKGALGEFFGGTVLSGQSHTEMTRLCDSLGYDWSIQDNQLQIIEKEGWMPDAPILLTPDTGLVGSPEPAKHHKGKPYLTKFRSLLQPRIVPRKRVQLQTASVNGLFGIVKVLHSGDTAGQEWYSNCEARAVS